MCCHVIFHVSNAVSEISLFQTFSEVVSVLQVNAGSAKNLRPKKRRRVSPEGLKKQKQSKVYVNTYENMLLLFGLEPRWFDFIILVQLEKWHSLSPRGSSSKLELGTSKQITHWNSSINAINYLFIINNYVLSWLSQEPLFADYCWLISMLLF